MTETERLTVLGLAFSRRERPILTGVDLAVSPGEIVCLIGPNGSGKSTLLRCIAGALVPAAGRITAGGRDLMRVSARERADVLSYAPQETVYAFAFTVAEFIGLSQMAGPSSATPSLPLSRWIEQLDLTALAHRSLLTLSGGERQRAAVARALAQEAPYVLLDEPTAHLDLQHQKLLLDLLRTEAKERRRGILLVLHDLNLAALAADRLYLLHQGTILASGVPSEVITEQNIQVAYQTQVRLLTGEGDRPVMLLQ